jgi:hypothetical protein
MPLTQKEENRNVSNVSLKKTKRKPPLLSYLPPGMFQKVRSYKKNKKER